MCSNSETKFQEVAGRLIEETKKTRLKWGSLEEAYGRNATKLEANEFLLGASLDRQYEAAEIWKNTDELAEYLGHPEDLWQVINDMPQNEWSELWDTYCINPRLRNFGNQAVKCNASILINKYDGDARNIWMNQEDKCEIKRRLQELRGMGPALSDMILGALQDTGQISVLGLDVKTDTHVRNVVGRVFYGESCSVEEVKKITKEMYPDNPWSLDRPLYLLGKEICHADNPNCEECYLADLCKFFVRRG